MVLVAPAVFLVPTESQEIKAIAMNIPHYGNDKLLLLIFGLVGTAVHLNLTWSLRYAPSATTAPSVSGNTDCRVHRLAITSGNAKWHGHSWHRNQHGCRFIYSAQGTTHCLACCNESKISFAWDTGRIASIFDPVGFKCTGPVDLFDVPI